MWLRAVSDIGSIGTYTSCFETAVQLAMLEGFVLVSKALLLPDASRLVTGSSDSFLRQLSGAEVKGEARLGVGVAGSGRAETG